MLAAPVARGANRHASRLIVRITRIAYHVVVKSSRKLNR
jgi:hypothetical protein